MFEPLKFYCILKIIELTRFCIRFKAESKVLWFQPTIEDSRYNDSVCYQRFCCKIEFAVIKKLDMDPFKDKITQLIRFVFF